MALSLQGIGPVEIKGRFCTPQLNAENKLRLAEIKSYDNTADLVLASVFPDDEEYVQEFLKTAPALEKEILHAYLVGGDTAVKAVMDGVNENLKTIVAAATTENKNG